MKSTNQYRAKSTPKPATSKPGMTFAPMASGRITPSAKTPANDTMDFVPNAKGEKTYPGN